MKHVVHGSTPFGYMGDQGSAIMRHASEPLLPPYEACQSTFREKANPEEITFPYRMTLSMAGLGDAEGQLVREPFESLLALGSRRPRRRCLQSLVPRGEGGRAGSGRGGAERGRGVWASWLAVATVRQRGGCAGQRGMRHESGSRSSG